MSSYARHRQDLFLINNVEEDYEINENNEQTNLFFYFVIFAFS